MSEEILKALMELFALISKQDEGTSLEERAYVEMFLKQQLSEKNYKTYLQLFDEFSGVLGAKNTIEIKRKRNRIAMLDSVKTIKICEKINTTLVYKQKIIVVLRLLELMSSSNKNKEHKQELIYTVSDVFKIEKDVLSNIHLFVSEHELQTLDDVVFINDDLVFDEQKPKNHIFHEGARGNVMVLRADEDLWLLKSKITSREVLMNGLPVIPHNIYIFSNGSSIKFPSGKPIYYSDITSFFINSSIDFHIDFEARDIEYSFKNGTKALQNISIHENEGKLIGIMGGSGAGKTTLLNALMGTYTLQSGFVKINGLDVIKDKQKLQGVIGYVPQDDLLIEDLTVFQNLFFSAKLCFDNLSEAEIVVLVNKTLSNLGLLDIKDLKVGNPLNKTISGGQRKRLNIALELIREPSIIFFDEPTSGLSSRDSENVMDLLRELTLKGKLVFVVIHQPSSDIYKMFDKIIIMDVGGYMIYYGNPIEAVSYFKKLDHQINSDISECPSCGNVNPELIFNIIDAKVVDEYGNLTDERKVSPYQWRLYFEDHKYVLSAKKSNDTIPQNLFIPTLVNQFKIFTLRDFLSKISNKQYILINLLEVPVLGFFLSFIIKYNQNPSSNEYIFRLNDNIPSYLFMGVIVSLFVGLTVSAEEIYRDKKILKREQFLNLSRHSYLLSKLSILFLLSAIQSFLFVLIGNYVLEIKGMLMPYWIMFFSVFCLSNLLGLNISSAFNSAVTIYIIIPLLIIPQLILGGALFSYEKINKLAGGGFQVPLVAEFMPSRWAYEGLMVKQFKDNDYQKSFFELDQKISNSSVKSHYWITDLQTKIDYCRMNLFNKNDSVVKNIKNNLTVIKNEFEKELKINPFFKYKNTYLIDKNLVDQSILADVKLQLELLNMYYEKVYDTTSYIKEKFLLGLKDAQQKGYFENFRNSYFNEQVSDIVKKNNSNFIFYNTNYELIQVIDPIYQTPVKPDYFTFKYPFFIAKKYFLSLTLDTYWYNILFLWLYSVILYFMLYYEILYKLLRIFSFI